MTTTIKNRSFVLLLFIFGIICASFLFAHFFGNDIPFITQVPQSAHNKTVGQIMKGTVIIQELQMKKDMLHALEIELATWNRKNTNLNKLIILNQEFSILEELEFSSDSVKDNRFQLFKLKNPIKIGRSRSFFVCLTSEEGQLMNCITAWTDTNGVVGKLFKEPIVNNELTQAVVKRKNPIKGSLQIKVIESDKTRYTKSFIFMFILLVISGIFIYKLAYNSQSKIHENIFVSIFVILFFVPSLYFIVFNSNKTQSSNWEKRLLATLPVFRFENLNNYLPQLESYINDHIPYREEIVTFRARVYYKVFGKSSFPKTSIIGKDGWFFRAREVLTANGNRTISIEEVERIIKTLHNRAQYYDSLGIKFYIAVVPSKSEVYKEYLPNYCKQQNDNIFTSYIINGLSKDTTFNLIDLKPTLINAKKEGQIYYKTDMHWSAFGAFHAYNAIINRIGEDFPSVLPINAEDISVDEGELITSGDATELALQNIVTEQYSYLRVKNSRSSELTESIYEIPEDFKHRNEYLLIRGLTDSSLPKIIVVRDSFTQALTGILSENFSKTIFIWDNWKYGVNKDIVEAEKPDIILMIVYIGFLPNILEDTE